jgi:drug/metabolite transporter (DMT)-like permease
MVDEASHKVRSAGTSLAFGSVDDLSGLAGISKLGIFLCLLSAVFFAFSITLAKMVYSYGMSPTTFAVIRAFSSVIISGGMAIYLGSLWRLPHSVRKEVLPVTVLFLMIAFGYPTAMKYVPASIASLTFYLFPLIILIIGAFKERRFPGIRRTSICLTAFVGLGVVLAPSLGDVQWQGIAAGVIAAVGVALYILKLPKIMAETNGMVLTVYVNSLNVVVLLVAAWLFGEFNFPTELTGWLAVGVSGVFYGVATVMLVFAVKLTNPVTASTLSNLEPLVVTVLAAYLFAEFLEPVQYIGMVVVIGALMFASLRNAPE